MKVLEAVTIKKVTGYLNTTCIILEAKCYWPSHGHKFVIHYWFGDTNRSYNISKREFEFLESLLRDAEVESTTHIAVEKDDGQINILYDKGDPK